MGERHAYMIMAHHRFDILEEIIRDLDYPLNDIFLHVDIKSKGFVAERFQNIVKKGKLYIVKRMDVHWGGFSQIECVLMLLKAACQEGVHQYYHFMVGVEYPLKSQHYIHNFFEINKGHEFIGFDNADRNYMERIRYYHAFNEYARNNNYFQKLLNKIRIFFVFIQRWMKVDLTKRYNLIFKKGNANWSITQDLANYVISQETMIKKIYKHSFCGDEIFIHTLVYNSPFWGNVYDIQDEYHSSMRAVTWNNPQNRYELRDLQYLLNCNRLFARKIDGEDALELIAAIKEQRKP